MAKKKKGPKPLPPGEKRTTAVLIKLNAAERAYIEQKAHGRPLASYGREKMLAG
jgi:hypothetical protein